MDSIKEKISPLYLSCPASRGGWGHPEDVAAGNAELLAGFDDVKRVGNETTQQPQGPARGALPILRSPGGKRKHPNETTDS